MVLTAGKPRTGTTGVVSVPFRVSLGSAWSDAWFRRVSITQMRFWTDARFSRRVTVSRLLLVLSRVTLANRSPCLRRGYAVRPRCGRRPAGRSVCRGVAHSTGSPSTNASITALRRLIPMSPAVKSSIAARSPSISTTPSSFA